MDDSSFISLFGSFMESSFNECCENQSRMSSGSMGWSPQSVATNGSSDVVTSDDDQLFSELLQWDPTPGKVLEINPFPRPEPKLEIMEQPREIFRFRYLTESQGAPHGAVMGAKATKSRRIFPTVQLHNYEGEAVIRCWLITAEDPPTPHVHRLITRVSARSIKEEPHDILVNESNNHTASFENLVIIHAVKKTCFGHYNEKKVNFTLPSIEWQKVPQETDLSKKSLGDLKKEIGRMNMNICRLYFEAFAKVDGAFQRLCSVTSHPIKNKKNAEFGDLKIVRSDKLSGSCIGGDEVFIFVEKVLKDIKIKFYEEDDSGEIIWSSYASFTSLDIHHLVAIAFRTPAYKNINITTPVKVQYQLERPSDFHVSNSMDFTYIPTEHKSPLKRLRPEETFYPSTEINLEQLLQHEEGTTAPTVDYFIHLNGFELPEGLSVDGPGPTLGNTQLRELSLTEPNTSFTEGKNMLRDCGDSLKSQLATLKPDFHEVTRLLSSTTEDDGNSALHWAVILNSKHLNTILDTLKVINTKKPLNAVNKWQQTPLHIATRLGKPEVVQKLLTAGADPNALDNKGRNCLHYAALWSTDCLEPLLTCGESDPYQATEDGDLPLHLAVKANNIRAIKTLLRSQVRPDVYSSKTGDTPVHLSVMFSRLDILRELLQHNADVDAQNYAGNTPLHLAVAKNDVRYAQSLLEYSARTDLKSTSTVEDTDQGLTVFDMATTEEMLRLLEVFRTSEM